MNHIPARLRLLMDFSRRDSAFIYPGVNSRAEDFLYVGYATKWQQIYFILFCYVLLAESHLLAYYIFILNCTFRLHGVSIAKLYSIFTAIHHFC
jgi:hypothetical protein